MDMTTLNSLYLLFFAKHFSVKKRANCEWCTDVRSLAIKIIQEGTGTSLSIFWFDLLHLTTLMLPNLVAPAYQATGEVMENIVYSLWSPFWPHLCEINLGCTGGQNTGPTPVLSNYTHQLLGSNYTAQAEPIGKGWQPCLAVVPALLILITFPEECAECGGESSEMPLAQ